MINHDEEYAENLLSGIWGDSAILADAEQTFEGKDLETLNEAIERLVKIQQNSLKGKI